MMYSMQTAELRLDQALERVQHCIKYVYDRSLLLNVLPRSLVPLAPKRPHTPISAGDI